MSQIPAVIEPFDIEEFIKEVPEKENAFSGFEQAGSQLQDVPRIDYAQYQVELETGWDFDTSILDEHLENNRAALNTWLAATEKDHYQPPSEWTSTESPMIAVSSARELYRLASSQIQKFGKINQPEAAIPWIRAQLRSTHLIRRRGDAINYSVGVAVFSISSKTINTWAAHPELSRPDIDRAREALRNARRLNPSPSEYVKTEFVSGRSFHELWNDTLIDDAFSESYGSTAWRAWLAAEPEYTLQLLPHIARNHLLFIEADRRDRPSLINGELFEDATASLAERGNLRSTDLAKLIKNSHIIYAPNLSGTLRLIDRDEARYRCLTVALASQAYFRDHGEFPDKGIELVPEYLDEFPDDLYSPTPAPLLYRRDGIGAVAYSRFTNEIDDGGTEVDYGESSTPIDLLDYGYRIRNPFEQPLVAPRP